MSFISNTLNTLTSSVTNRIIFVTVVTHIVLLAFFAGQRTGLEIYSWHTENFAWYQLLTHMFLHGSETHLLFNMFGLWMFGRVIEQVLGKKRFFILYLSCGIGAAIISQLVDDYIFQQVYYGAMVGASGAIYGLLAAFAIMFPNFKIMLIFLPVPIAAKFFVPVLLLIDLTAGFIGFSIFGQNIAHFAHIGGAIIGFFMIFYFRRRALR